MAQTQVPFGSVLAKKVYGAAVFAEMVRQPGLFTNMTGPAPGADEVRSKLEKMQTSPDYPIVRVSDLSKSAGASVSVDVFNILQGKPVMGDTKLAGKMMSLTYASMDIKIDQMRGGVDAGGRMTQQRTIHNLRGIGRAGLVGWWARASSQIKTIHLAGARGDENTPSWVVPLASDPDFTQIMVNTVRPPTISRHFYPADATSIATIEASDTLTIDELDRLRVRLDELETPMQSIKLPDDPGAHEGGIFLLLVSPRTWHHFETVTTTNNAPSWRTFLMNARERGSKNPLFTGECGMWNGIVVRKMPYWVSFNTGTAVPVSAAATDDTTTTSTAAVPIHRCILLGAQAMAEVWGQHHSSGTHFNWHEETTDHGNTFEASVAGMGGYDKLRFTDSSGNRYDHGVAVLDVSAPSI